MRLSGFKVRRLNSVLGWCLCLVLIILLNAIAAETMRPGDVGAAQSSTGDRPPVIQTFKAEPGADGAWLYTFVVKRADKVQIIESGNIIREIDNPTLATLKGTVKGLPDSSIKTDESGNFMAVLLAGNQGGSVKAELTLSLAAEITQAGLPAGSTDNRTPARTPKWLDQYSTPTASITSTITRNQPNFYKCPNNCAFCLKPADAASLGFTQRCSPERCYYSPDDRQSWYCYSEPEGYCCANGVVSQSTKGECAKIGGYWSTSQAEALRVCQPLGWCCANGNLYQGTKDQCAQMGGSYWSTSQAETMANCRQAAACWCCLRGQVYQTTKDQCAQSGGGCYNSQSEAAAACYQTPLRTPTFR